MQHRSLLLVLLFLILSCSSTFLAMLEVEKAEKILWSASEDLRAGSGTCSIGVDKRIELLTAIQLFTSWRETGIITGDLPYKQDMLDYFEPFSGHRAVMIFEDLTQAGFSYDAPVGFMTHLSDPPRLQVVVPFSEYHIAGAGGADILEEFVEALRSFCWESGFEEFWDSHQEFYRDLERRAYADVPLESTVDTLEDFFGTRQHSYYVVLAPMLQGGYAYRIETEGSFDIYAIYGPTEFDGDTPLFRGFYYEYFVDCFTYPIVEEFLEQHENLTRLIEACGEWQYPRWARKDVWVTNAHVELAVTAWLFNRYQYLEYYEKMGVLYIKPVYNLLYQYDRRVYGSFREFYPQILDLFNTIACGYDLLVQVVNEGGESIPQATVSVLLPDGRETGSKLTDSAGRVVFEDLLGITYSIKASSPGYYDQTIKATLKNREQTKTIALEPMPFHETLLGKTTIAGGVIAALLATAAFIVLRRRRAQRRMRRRWQPSYRPYR